MADETPSRLSRLMSLGAMTSRVASSYVREQVKSALTGKAVTTERQDAIHIENARDMANVMSRMKGAAMKLGQQIAVMADTFDLPSEVSDALSALHAKAEPVPMRVIQAEIERELNKPLDQLFSWFDPNPLGTASLAQAHAAKLPDGREVVVKVLHRGVKESVDTDIATIKAVMLSQAATFGRPRAELEDIFSEIRERLLEELDYLHEAVNISSYHRIFAGDTRIRIPSVLPSLCTDRMIVMDRVPGVPIDLFADMATPEARQRAGVTLSEFYYEQVFVHRMLHADPHPGNYLFGADGTVGVLDFGCVKRFDLQWMATYGRIAIAALDCDRETALKHCIELGAWDGQNPASGDALWAFILAITKGFRSGTITLGADGEHMADELMAAGKGLIRHTNVRAPRDVIFLHRSLGGLYSMGRKLNTTQDYGALLRQHAQRAIDAAAAAPQKTK
jgi:predicted unusual protein kinase regulating ubiquinone biosynthesis (AarF/ABC1/UbiB family)